MKGHIKDPRIFVKDLDIDEVPNIARIAKECGVHIYQNEIKRDVVAIYIKKRSGFEITVNINLPVPFQRFLVAYLLSYIRIYGDVKTQGVVNNESLYDRKAYYEAIDLLIPNAACLNLFLNDENIFALADYYRVSESLIYAKMNREKEKNKLKILKFKED